MFNGMMLAANLMDDPNRVQMLGANDMAAPAQSGMLGGGMSQGGYGEVSGYMPPVAPQVRAGQMLQAAVENVPEPYSYRNLYPVETYNPMTDIMVEDSQAPPGQGKQLIRRREPNPQYAQAAMLSINDAAQKGVNPPQLHEALMQQHETTKQQAQQNVVMSDGYQALTNPRYAQAKMEAQQQAQALEGQRKFTAEQNQLDRDNRVQINNADNAVRKELSGGAGTGDGFGNDVSMELLKSELQRVRDTARSDEERALILLRADPVKNSDAVARILRNSQAVSQQAAAEIQQKYNLSPAQMREATSITPEASGATSNSPAQKEKVESKKTVVIHGATYKLTPAQIAAYQAAKTVEDQKKILSGGN
jgi:hypothetical protein